MTLTRRGVLRIGGGLLAGLRFGADAARAAGVIEIIMRGNEDGSRVWFEPVGLLVQPGQSVRWTNRDAGNSHTATAYHPDNGDHPLRIPGGASPWNSDYLLPEESFSVTLTVPGVYDYFCVPHEHAGMVGRIVVAGSSSPVAPRPGGLPQAAEKKFPRVADIIRNGRVDAR